MENQRQNANIVQGKIIDFGAAPYKNDAQNQESYFVKLQGRNGDTRTLWGVGVRDAMQLKQFNKGDNVEFVDKGLAEGSKKRNWEVEKYKPAPEMNNSIQSGFEQKKDKPQSVDVDINDHQRQQAAKGLVLDEDIDLPTNVKNNYVAKIANRGAILGERINFYEKGADVQAVAFEDRTKSLNTSREDSKTIKAMLDLSQKKGWDSIKLRGTEEFKREAWLQAQVRGIETKGYKPSEKDLVELENRKENMTVNRISNDYERVQTTPKQKEKLENDKWARVAIDTKTAATIAADRGVNAAEAAKIEREAFVRSNEFDAGRDVSASLDLDSDAGAEHFEKNFAAPYVKNRSNAEVMRKVEANFHKKTDGVVRNQTIKDIKEHENNLSHSTKLAVESYRRAIDYQYKNDPEARQQHHDQLNEKIPEMVKNNIELPAPTIKVQQEINIKTNDKGSQDRGR